jgi:uncharacterized membrane protein YedE/YeeE
MNEHLEPMLGGILIGLGSLLAMAVSGKVPGISGIAGHILRGNSGDTAWRVVFVLGLIGGAAIAFALNLGSGGFAIPGDRSLPVYAIAGFLVGFGARVGGGCTSGHGVCGIGSGAKDGLLYTIVFFTMAAATVFVWNLVAKGAGAG